MCKVWKTKGGKFRVTGQKGAMTKKEATGRASIANAAINKRRSG